MPGYRLLLSSIAGAALLAAIGAHAPALADVKAGAEAWSRGDYTRAVKEWEGPAEQGDTDALFNLGQAYKLGRGVPRDLPKAEVLFSKAAAKGHIAAADNYGLLLFDRGERATAMPYVHAASERGDPRAQYLMGIAHFNGDLAPKDWIRAYALMTLAQNASLPQAAPALKQMDQYIPLTQRQAAAALAAQLAQKAQANRNSQLAAADLGVRPAAPQPVAAAAMSASAVSPPIVRPDAAVPSALRTAAGDSPATAGADYARPAATARPAPLSKPAPAPQPVPVPKPVPAPAAKPVPAAKPAHAPASVPAPAEKPAAAAGNWRVQFGAFAVPANADALWARIKGHPEVAGHARINASAGKVIKLQAGGYATRAAASAACAGLAKAAITCIPAQD